MYKGKTEILILLDHGAKKDMVGYVLEWLQDHKVSYILSNGWDYIETDEFVLQMKTTDYLTQAVRSPEYFIDICRDRYMMHHQNLVENQLFAEEDEMGIDMLDMLLYDLSFT